MNAKNIIRMILLIAMLAGSFAITNSAFAASACGSNYTIVRGDTLRIIAAKCDTTIYALRRANPEIGSGDLIYPGQNLLLPGSTIYQSNGALIYIVARGDTLKSIAARFNMNMDTLTWQNPEITNANWIYEGQRLIVNGSGGNPNPAPMPPAVSSYTIQPGDTLKKIAARFNISVEQLLQVNPQITNPNWIYTGQVISIPDPASTYVVQQGDTMKKIAERFGISLSSLLALNPNITNPNWIYPGQIIRVR
jgi:LysM repeat protein